MDLQIRGNGVSVSPELREFAAQKVARLDRLVQQVDVATLELRQAKSRSGSRAVTAQITLQSGPTVLRAEESDHEVKIAIDRAVDKLARQVQKVHSKRAHRKGAGGASIRTENPFAIDAGAVLESEFDLDEDGDGERDEFETVPSVVRRKQFVVKPMHVEEAIEQMELLGHSFYLFENADDRAVSVIYRRDDGAYGLISPAGS